MRWSFSPSPLSRSAGSESGTASIRDGEKAVELDPQDASLAVNLIQTYSGLRRFKESERVADAAVRRLGKCGHDAAVGGEV